MSEEKETEVSRIRARLAELRGEEEQKLKALAQLQQYYVDARSDEEREQVRQAVAEIREISKKARQEIRELNTQLAKLG